MGKEYKVYRVDSHTKTRTPIGTITERRKQIRGPDSHLGLINLARKIFALSPEDQMRIVVGEDQVA